MNKLKEIPIEINENSFLNSFKLIKGNRETNNKHTKFFPILKFYFFIIFILFFMLCYVIYLLNQKICMNNEKINNIQEIIKDLNNKMYNHNHTHNNTDNILEPYIKAQKDFCDNHNKYYNQKYENDIVLSDIKFNDLKYRMYLFKSENFIQYEFKKYGSYEIALGNHIIEALNYYTFKNNEIKNKDIYMLDIGGNVGWYPSLLGRYNYSILSFEAFEKNSYVAKKNYCYLNKNSNVIIITKGLGNEEKKCHYFNQLNNTGNGMIICNDKNILNDDKINKLFIKESDVEMTTLNSFIPFLFTKKVALMKLDVEGHELQVLEGGAELITIYHVPFVVLEFSPIYLKEVGSNPEKLVQFFVKNGYKISLNGFLSKKYITADELLNKVGFQKNCYFIHNSIKY